MDLISTLRKFACDIDDGVKWITVHPDGHEKGTPIHLDREGKVDSEGVLSRAIKDQGEAKKIVERSMQGQSKEKIDSAMGDLDQFRGDIAERHLGDRNGSLGDREYGFSPMRFKNMIAEHLDRLSLDDPQRRSRLVETMRALGANIAEVPAGRSIVHVIDSDDSESGSNNTNTMRKYLGLPPVAEAEDYGTHEGAEKRWHGGGGLNVTAAANTPMRVSCTSFHPDVGEKFSWKGKNYTMLRYKGDGTALAMGENGMKTTIPCHRLGEDAGTSDGGEAVDGDEWGVGRLHPCQLPRGERPSLHGGESGIRASRDSDGC